MLSRNKKVYRYKFTEYIKGNLRHFIRNLEKRFPLFWIKKTFFFSNLENNLKFCDDVSGVIPRLIDMRINIFQIY